jgi:N-hydroxyarylamine O-acetyltransferase
VQAGWVEETQATAYLARIGAPWPQRPDAAALRDLHRAHLLAVPFENLSIALGEPISLEPGDLLSKVVTHRRGGFCYELNGAFALLLETLGFGVRRVAAAVFGASAPGPPLDHLALLVDVPGEHDPWLADVGFGSHSQYPLRFTSRQPQHDPAGTFQLTDADGPGISGPATGTSGTGTGGAADVDVLLDGRPQYRVERRTRSLADFVPMCWWQQTSPASHFTQSTICSRLTQDGRVSLSGRTLIQTRDGTRTERELASDTAILAAYREHFGIALDRVPVAAPPAGAPAHRAPL